jgi:mannitol-1-phosphate/altronate dehydrogenase
LTENRGLSKPNVMHSISLVPQIPPNPVKRSLDSIAPITKRWQQDSPYNRKTLETGIIHFGPGRFFRGHFARIIHQYLAHKKLDDQRWGICGVSLKSRETIAKLQPQNYLYTLVERYCSAETHESAEVTGSINQIIDGTQQPEYILELMTSPTIHLVTLTVTQAGYCLDAQFNLDTAHRAIAHDLHHPATPATAIGFITEALRRRRDRGVAPFTTLSCDNLPKNGEILQRAILHYANLIDPELSNYLKQHATFPNTVVDRIVPQAQEADTKYPCQLLQISDRAPIVTEPFWQFVVEDKFKGDRPDWEQVGVIMTEDITPYLHMKSRFLNAMHSFIACLAVRSGIEYIHEAMELPEFYGFSQLLMEDIAAATPVPARLCQPYQDEILRRFSNEALPDTIERIADETARKVRKYIVPIIQDAHAQNVSIKRLILPIAAWLLAVREGSESGKIYYPKDQSAVISTIRSGAFLSQVIGLEANECTHRMDRECDRLLQAIQRYGLLSSLRHSCEEDYEVISAA